MSLENHLRWDQGVSLGPTAGVDQPVNGRYSSCFSPDGSSAALRVPTYSSSLSGGTPSRTLMVALAALGSTDPRLTGRPVACLACRIGPYRLGWVHLAGVSAEPINSKY